MNEKKKEQVATYMLLITPFPISFPPPKIPKERRPREKGCPSPCYHIEVESQEVVKSNKKEL